MTNVQIGVDAHSIRNNIVYIIPKLGIMVLTEVRYGIHDSTTGSRTMGNF